MKNGKQNKTKGFEGSILWIPNDNDWGPIIDRMVEAEKKIGRKMTEREQTEFLVGERWKGNLRYIMVEEEPKKVGSFLAEHLLDAKIRTADQVKKKRAEEK